MRGRMTITTPRIIALAFNTSGEFVTDFVENKLLKWSLESFRDVVHTNLALERGEAEGMLFFAQTRTFKTSSSWG